MKTTLRNVLALSATLFSLGVTDAAQAQTAYALVDGNTLLTFNLSTPGTVTTVGSISGAVTALTDIDFRVSNGQLYGYNQATNQIVTINTSTGATTLASTVQTPVTDILSAIDFNPAADRLRIVNTNDQNLRINVDNGSTTVDGTLAYSPGNPNITDVAYTNNDNNAATGTTIYYIDNNLGTLVTSGNPNSGLLTTVGSLGPGQVASGNAGFDIYTDANGVNIAYAFRDIPGTSTPGLYNINLGSGAASLLGAFGGGGSTFGLAIVPFSPNAVPEPGSFALFVGMTATSGVFALRKRRARK